MLFVYGEMALVDTKECLLNLLGKEGCTNFHLTPSEDLYRAGCLSCLFTSEEQEAILRVLQHMKSKDMNPKFIVLDNLSTLRREENENYNSKANMLLDFFYKT